MNTGIIASRYAQALLILAKESGRAEQVCNQARCLLDDSERIPERLEPELEKLVALLKANGRVDYLKFVLKSFVRKYYDSEGICMASLTTVVPAPELSEKLCKLVSGISGKKLLLETFVDPSIVGGFVFDVDDHVFDASVATQIETIRREFIEKNTRLV